MDIQEITRLHTRYNEPPLTIEMPTDDRTVPLLDGPSATSSTASRAVWACLTEAQRLLVALAVVAGIAFPIGMWTASAGKHSVAPSTEKAELATVPKGAASATSTAESHERPPKAPTAPAERLAAEQAQADAPIILHDGPAALAAAAPSVTAPASAAVPMSKPAAKALPAPAKSAVATGPAPAPTPAASPARPASATGEIRRSNEIKLF